MNADVMRPVRGASQKRKKKKKKVRQAIRGELLKNIPI